MQVAPQQCHEGVHSTKTSTSTFRLSGWHAVQCDFSGVREGMSPALPRLRRCTLHGKRTDGPGPTARVPCGREFWASLLLHLPLCARASRLRCSPHPYIPAPPTPHFVSRPHPINRVHVNKARIMLYISASAGSSRLHNDGTASTNRFKSHDWCGIQYDDPCPAGGRHCLGVGMPRRRLIPHCENWRAEVIQASSESCKAMKLH